MKAFIRIGISIFVLSVYSQTVLASGGGDKEDRPDRAAPLDPDYVQAQNAIKDKEWEKSIALLNQAAKRDANNADIYNLLGYAERNLHHLDAAFQHYERALSLNPKHRGAHEYLGEAYLMTGNLAKAEEHLAILDKLCFFPCEQYRDLKEKVTEYKEKR